MPSTARTWRPSVGTVTRTRPENITSVSPCTKRSSSRRNVAAAISAVTSATPTSTAADDPRRVRRQIERGQAQRRERDEQQDEAAQVRAEAARHRGVGDDVEHPRQRPADQGNDHSGESSEQSG